MRGWGDASKSFKQDAKSSSLKCLLDNLLKKMNMKGIWKTLEFVKSFNKFLSYSLEKKNVTVLLKGLIIIEIMMDIWFTRLSAESSTSGLTRQSKTFNSTQTWMLIVANRYNSRGYRENNVENVSPHDETNFLKKCLLVAIRRYCRRWGSGGGWSRCRRTVVGRC